MGQFPILGDQVKYPVDGGSTPNELGRCIHKGMETQLGRTNTTVSSQKAEPWIRLWLGE